MPRPIRLHSETGIYHVMARGNRRTAIFNDKVDKKRLINIIINKKRDHNFNLYSYCIMDNHYHLLIKDVNDNLPTIMKMINSSYAAYYNNKYEGVGHVFQNRYRSEPVNNEQYLLGVTRYIHNNPVKAGITKSCKDYPWSSYQQYLYYNKSNELLDVSYILGLYSNNLEKAIEKLISFTELENTDIYLDDYCEKDEEERVRKYIHSILIVNQLSMDDLLNNKQNIRLRNDIIKNIKNNNILSQERIAEIIGVNRNIIKNA